MVGLRNGGFKRFGIVDRTLGATANVGGRVLGLVKAAEGPLPPEVVLAPHTAGRRYSFTHYNVVIPNLPAPHRFLACCVFMGRSGARMFDTDHAVRVTPRSTATLAVGTAATAPDWFQVYNTDTDCELNADGSLLRFGDDLSITGRFPDYRISINRPGLSLQLTAKCSPHIVWFARGPVYDHVGFPTRYAGTLTWQGATRPIEGILSLEYAHAMSLVRLRDRNIPRLLKIPADFFTYHVIDLHDDTLLMLTHVEGLGKPVMTTAHLKQIGGVQRRHVRDVQLEILGYRAEPKIAPDGNATRIPERYRWRIVDSGGTVTTEIVATTDTDLIYGVGRGWIGGYTYEGHHDGAPISGTAYYEHISLEN